MAAGSQVVDDFLLSRMKALGHLTAPYGGVELRLASPQNK
jgi:hypothetical protein